MKAGSIEGMTMPGYRAHEGVSASDLKNMQRSPAYAHMKEHTATPAQEWGTAVHTAILEPHELADRYRLEPQQPADNHAKLWRGTKAYKEARAALLAQPDVEGVLSAEEMESLRWIQKRVRESDVGSSLYEFEGSRELSVFAHDDDFKLWRKCRPDWYVPEIKLVVDVKTAENHTAGAFSRAAYRYGYHMTDAFYRDTMTMAGLEVEHYVFLVVNSTPPHEVAIYTYDEDSLAQGRRDYIARLFDWRECVETGRWESGSQSVEEIRLPYWAFDQ